jgi:hypothetical protein
MTIRAAILFTPDGLATPVLRGQWVHQDPLQPIQANNRLVGDDGTASAYFRGLWQLAFPDRPSLPADPIATRDGRGEGRFWDLLVP